jgi:hypothetical protein
MKRLIAVSALVVGFSSAMLLLGVVIAALTTLCPPVGLGPQQAAAAGPTAPRGAFHFSPKLPLKAASGTPMWSEQIARPKLDHRPTGGRIPTGTKTVVSWPRSCGRADRASVAFVIEPQQPTKAKTVVTWPGSCGRGDRASVAFVIPQEPTKAVGVKEESHSTVPVTSSGK